MELNTKLWVEDLMKQIREEIKGVFTTHESTINLRFTEMEASSQRREEHATSLESSTVEIDKSLAVWKPEVESSLTAVRLKLTKLNSFFNRDARAVSSPNMSVLPLESAATRSSAGQPTDGPNGHCSDNSHWDCGFGQVFTQVHDPITSTMHTPSPPNSPFQFALDHGVDSSTIPNSGSAYARMQMSKLPKMNFPK
jgi:hypothetical protein